MIRFRVFFVEIFPHPARSLPAESRRPLPDPDPGQVRTPETGRLKLKKAGLKKWLDYRSEDNICQPTQGVVSGIRRQHISMKKKILIADDDRTVLNVLKMVLDKAGYRTETIPSGKTLLNHPPGDSDLILLDVRMSGIDGVVVCKHLKSQESTKNIPIIMVSAVPELHVLKETAGADDFLQKPFNMRTLLNIVEKYIVK